MVVCSAVRSVVHLVVRSVVHFVYNIVLQFYIVVHRFDWIRFLYVIYPCVINSFLARCSADILSLHFPIRVELATLNSSIHPVLFAMCNMNIYIAIAFGDSGL